MAKSQERIRQLTLTEYLTLGENALIRRKVGNDYVLIDVNEIFKLDGLEATTDELNILAGATVSTAQLNALEVMDGISASSAELNILDGAVVTTDELNILSGLTATTAELNALGTIDGLTATAAELNTLDGITSNTTELNVLDGITATTGELNILTGVTATAEELNILDDVIVTVNELNVLGGVTATVEELNTLDGVTATTDELNINDVSSRHENVSATNLITPAETGKHFILNSAAGFVSTLPAVSTGLQYYFYIGATAPTTSHTIVTNTDDDLIVGNITSPEDAAGGVSMVPVADTITFVANKAIEGDYAHLYCDGVKWFLNGMCSVQDGMTTTTGNTPTPPTQAWTHTGIPYIADGNLLSTGFPYDPTNDTTLAHPDLPDPWTSEVAGFYYVDLNTGSSSPTWGDPTAPLDKIPLDIQAGEVVVLASGIYDYEHTSPNDVTFNGIVSDLCWIIAANPASPPVIQHGFEISGQYGVIQDIDSESANWSGETGDMGITIQCDYLTIRRCEWQGNIDQGGWGIYNCHHVYIYDCDIYNGGDLNPASDIDEHGININLADDVWIIDNRIHDMSGDSVQVGGQAGAGATSSNRIYIAGNTCYNNRQTAVWCKEATDVIVSENIAYNMTNGAFNQPTCFGNQYDSRNLWFINNIMYDSHGGVFVAGSSNGNQYIVGNLIYDLTAFTGFDPANPWGQHGITCRGGVTHVVNNTIENCHSGLACVGTYEVTVNNNLFGPVNYANASQLFFESTTNKTSDYNFYYGPTSPVRFNSGTNSTLAAFQGAGFEANAVQGTDPGYTDEPSDDFSITGASVCKSAGTVSSVYATFLSRYGDSIAIDIDGNTRPAGTWDIGAYEAP